MINNPKITIIGLGYVGLPLAVEFSKKFSVVGYDTNSSRVHDLNLAIDKTNEVDEKELYGVLNSNKSLKNRGLIITSDIRQISDTDVFVITVPTPIDKNKKPDLTPLANATKDISKYVRKGNIIIYESTVYPGCTEEFCVPIIEKHSSLKFNKDFFCGYSPERINPEIK